MKFIRAALLLLALTGTSSALADDYDGHWHRWFAWHPVRLQGGKPIPSVQEGGKIIAGKTIERMRFFDRWVYREIGDKRSFTR
jgi:hypothetical protein